MQQEIDYDPIHPNTELERRKGRLVNIGYYTKDGVPFFKVRCDCGAVFDLKRRYYNSDGYSACPTCTKAGLAPNLKAHLDPRPIVDFDPALFALVGFDCSQGLRATGKVRLGVSMHTSLFHPVGVDPTVKHNCTAAVPRQLIADLGLLIRSASPKVRLTEAQWRALEKPTEEQPEALGGQLDPAVRVRALCRKAGFDFQPEPLEAAAILASLRWGLDHQWEGEWWRLEQRVTE